MNAMYTAIQNILFEMERQLKWDEMQAAEADEQGLLDEMDKYEKAAAVRRGDIAMVKSLLAYTE